MRCSDRVKQAPMALIAPTALALVSGLSLLLPATPGWAQDWPQPRAVRIVVPFTPGSATDVVSRAVFEQVSRQIGQPVVVENRAGGGTTIGSALVAKAEPDGHTLLVNSTSHVVVAAAFKNLSYSVADDFTSVAGLITQPFAVATRTRYKSIAELVQYGRANPGKLNYGTNGPGTSGHLFMEKFALAAKIKMTQIPFRGTPEAMTEVMADRLDMFPGPVLNTLKLAKDGRVNALAVSTTTRSAFMPDVPTLAEAGVPGADYVFWIGAFGPARMRPAVTERIHAEVQRAMAVPDVKAKIANLGADPINSSVAEFDSFVKREIKSNAEIFISAGIKME